MDVSLVSRASSSERSFVKSTFCVYVDRSASEITNVSACCDVQMEAGVCYLPSLRTMVLVRFCMDSSMTSDSTSIMAFA